MLSESIVDYPTVKYIFIGECSELKEKYAADQKHFCFMGYVNELEQVLEYCDLYLNPPRMGGGISGLMAIENGIPVITLSDGDVALYCGDFVVDNMEELKRELYCCLSDQKYLLKKKEKAMIMRQSANVSEEQSRENIKKCITGILEAAKCDRRRS